MDLRQFWMTWRRDIVRGAVLFAVILTAGLTISNLVGRARRGFHLNFDGPDAPELAGPAAPGDTAAVWTWTGKVAPQQSVWQERERGRGSGARRRRLRRGGGQKERAALAAQGRALGGRPGGRSHYLCAVAERQESLRCGGRLRSGEPAPQQRARAVHRAGTAGCEGRRVHGERRRHDRGRERPHQGPDRERRNQRANQRRTGRGEARERLSARRELRH